MIEKLKQANVKRFFKIFCHFEAARTEFITEYTLYYLNLRLILIWHLKKTIFVFQAWHERGVVFEF
jgi:hypothetical protein